MTLVAFRSCCRMFSIMSLVDDLTRDRLIPVYSSSAVTLVVSMLAITNSRLPLLINWAVSSFGVISKRFFIIANNGSFELEGIKTG